MLRNVDSGWDNTMVNQSLISVIVPVFNVQLYLHEAVESVIHQTYENLEIIIVDDGSTDGSGSLCDEYSMDPRVRVIHQENRGLSNARNVGLDICKGEMIAFLDPDDAFCPDMLSMMFEAMNRSGADIVECNFIVYKGSRRMNPQKISKRQKAINRYTGADSNGRKNCSHKDSEACIYNTRNALHMQIEGKMSASVWNKLYKHKVWKTLRFREGQNYEDFDIILSLIGEADKIFVLDDPLVMQRIRTGSITQTYTMEHMRDLSRAYKHYLDYIQLHIPEYFDDADAAFVFRKYYISLLSKFYKGLFQRSSDRKECKVFLENEINEVKKKIDIRECSLRVRLASFLYFHTPVLLSGAIYIAQRPFRILQHKLGL